MADFSSFNGYNVKDATARSNIATIQTDIDAINTKISQLESTSGGGSVDLLASGINASKTVTLSKSLSNYKYILLTTNYNTATAETDIDYGFAMIPVSLFKLGAQHRVNAHSVTSANMNTNVWNIKYVSDTSVSITLSNTYIRPRIYGVK